MCRAALYDEKCNTRTLRRHAIICTQRSRTRWRPVCPSPSILSITASCCMLGATPALAAAVPFPALQSTSRCRRRPLRLPLSPPPLCVPVHLCGCHPRQTQRAQSCVRWQPPASACAWPLPVISGGRTVYRAFPLPRSPPTSPLVAIITLARPASYWSLAMAIEAVNSFPVSCDQPDRRQLKALK